MRKTPKRVLSGIGVGLGLILFCVLFRYLPWWIDGSHLRESDLQPADGVVITGVRTGLVAVGAAFIAGAGLFYTHGTLKQTRQRDREQSDLVREGQVTDRYVEAIKLLANDEKITERLGGIYALERIMKDSEKDHATVVEVLAAFIREHASIRYDQNLEGEEGGSEYEDARPKVAIQAVLTVLGRRPIRAEVNRIDLRNVDLRGADLSGAYLVGFDFTGSDLRGCDFSASHLHRVVLRETKLDGAVFVESLMEEAFLDEAQGIDVNFNSAILRRVMFGSAHLENVDFAWADLWGSKWYQAKVDGVTFESADLRFSNFMNSSIEGGLFRNADLSLSQSAGSSYSDCSFEGAKFAGWIISTSDLMDGNILEPEQLTQAMIDPKVKLAEELSEDPVVTKQMEAHGRIRAYPILHSDKGEVDCCTSDENLSHSAGFMRSIPDGDTRNRLVSEAVEEMFR
ncbi:pentapeptide repeat-containing protein [Streptomyces celluloflavus]|uniref:pentapeptide repeat-containing protein n=1 Tax=Streptomyces celluloflavus TaxID=58344 RepID=UPI0036589659